jgi:hypothetical protein
MDPRVLGTRHERFGLVELAAANRAAGLAQEELDVVSRERTLRGGFSAR